LLLPIEARAIKVNAYLLFAEKDGESHRKLEDSHFPVDANLPNTRWEDCEKIPFTAGAEKKGVFEKRCSIRDPIDR
jgi:hypothetical protein